MNIALRRDWTVPEYLAWAAAQSERQRTELIDGQIVAMPSGLVVHTRLKMRACKALETALIESGLTGEVLIDGVAVPIDQSSAYEPDALLYLGPAVPAQQMTASEPVVVVEVLSPTTAHIDKGTKLAGYFTVPSLRHYLIIDPVTQTLTHHARGAAEGSIVATVHASDTLRLDPPGLEVSVNAILGTK